MDDLREAIDRLVRSGGRLTVEGAAGRVVVLEQPGIRFGILEVRGRITIPSSDGAEPLSAVLPSAWVDPNVTQRMGREVRLQPAEAGADGPQVRSRTWRVPPTLASELTDEIRGALGDIVEIDFQPLATRQPRTIDTDQHAEPAASSLPAHEEIVDDRVDRRRAVAWTLPTPVRAVIILGLVAAVGFLWAGMIRGAPRQPAAAAGTASSPVAGGAPGPASPSPPGATPSPSVTAGPIVSHLVGASTEESEGPAAAAIDGDPVTAWHAAFGVPQWIEIALDRPSTVSAVVLLIAQSESGNSRHMIQVARTGSALEVVGVVDRETGDHDTIVFRPETPIDDVERIRIETLASPSHAGWYEVIVR